MPPTKEEIDKIVKLHDEGYSQGRIAKELGRGKSTINRVLQSLGLTNGTGPETFQTKNANTWNRARRIQLCDKFIDIVCERIKKNPSNSDLKSLCTTFAIMVDKREIMEPAEPIQMEDDGFISALESKAEEVFECNDSDIPIQMDAAKPKTMADPDLVVQDITDSPS